MERTVKLSETNRHPTATRLPRGAGGGGRETASGFCFHSREFHVVIESQHRVHKSKRKNKREKLAPQKTFQKIHIYIFLFFFL